jgi:L-lactate utilization protein LutB
MTTSKSDLKRRIDRALGSRRLQTALERGLGTLGERRDAAVAQIDWPGLRSDLTERRRAAVEHIPELIERFTREAEAVGARV